MIPLLIKLSFVVYLGILIYFGFISCKPNWLGWFMFCRASFCYATICYKTELLNIWDYMDHTQVIIHKEMMDDLLRYLRFNHGKYPMSGTVLFYTNRGVVKYQVRNAWLV